MTRIVSSSWPEHPSDALLTQWLLNELSVHERTELDRWLQEDPSHQRKLDTLRLTLEPLTAPLVVDVTAATENLRAQLNKRSSALPARSARPGSTRRWGWVGVAAAGMAVMVAVLSTIPWNAAGTGNHIQARTYSTGPGERATIELSDGTRVVLNVASRLDIPEGFGSQTRKLTLQGEAAFTITHSAGLPFAVRAGGAEAIVLGTEFAMRAYEADTAVQVAVRSGRVSANGITLSAQDVARFGEKFSEIRRDRSADDAMAFVNGRLVISGMTLGDAVEQLERWYDVEIRFGSPELAKRRLDATLQSTSQTDLVNTLELALYARVAVDGTILTLYSR